VVGVLGTTPKSLEKTWRVPGQQSASSYFRKLHSWERYDYWERY